MALVAATAVGLALHRAFWLEAIPVVHGASWRAIVVTGMAFSTPGAMAWTTAILALQFQPGRGRRRRLARPGAAVCCAACSAMVVGIVPMVCVNQGRNSVFLINDLMLFGLPALAAASVASTWVLIMILTGYRRSSDWADRLGRVMGLYWLLWIPVLGWSLIGR